MTRRRCECQSAADECGFCSAAIGQAMDDRLFADGHTDRHAADAAAAREVWGR